MTQQKMSIREWWDEVGTDNVLKIIKELGTSFNYFRMYRYELKRPRPDKARLIIKACDKHTPGFAPDFEVMLAPVKKRTNRFCRTIEPSEAFLAAQGAANVPASI